ncbi:MAG: ParB/RepB/Spo0J family partition protein [Clostridia bacterium]|nr:ParB/RepB/Spo0J family partition protein [Clostridia bacterium]
MLKNQNKLKKSNEVVLIPARMIQPSPHQPRKNFNWDDLEGLAESIHYNGLLQPVTVRKKENGRYELISGERRLRACKMAGLSSIPSIIVDINDEKSALLAVIENLQRENLHFFEEAMAIERLIKGFGLSQEEVSRKLGKSQSALSNKLRILRLPDEIRYNITIFGLTERHARALLRLPSVELMEQVLDTIVEQGLTVSATEQLICDILTKSQDKNKKGKKVMVFKDIRIFINTLNHAVTTMRKSGISAKAIKNETDTHIEYTVKIEKPVNSQ